jgi:peptidoglycan/xylan/chitin deacetylase (PgdA/CDA1 family)
MIKNLKKNCKTEYLRFTKILLSKGILPFSKKNNGFLILNYHSVQKDNNYPFAISPEDFEFQLRYLANNFKIKTVAEIVEHISTGKNTSDILVGITFDDGYIDNYKYALPILQKYNVPAMFFINPNIIDLQYESFMSWKEIIEIANMEFIQFGSHGLSHLPLSVLQKKDIEIEISKSKTILENRLKKDIIFFAFPFGMVHPECQELLESYHYIAGFITVLNNDKTINPYTIGRLVMNKNNSIPNYFEIAVAKAIRSYQNSSL